MLNKVLRTVVVVITIVMFLLILSGKTKLLFG